MMFPGDIVNNIGILAKNWLEYLFNLDGDVYEDFEMYLSSGQVMINAWLKPMSRKPGWVEIDIGQGDDVFEGFSNDFKIAFASFERNKLHFSVDIRTKSDLTEYSMNYAPDHIRNEWKSGYHCKYDYIKKQGEAMGIKPAKKEESYKLHPIKCDFNQILE